jgi:4a-hydroxytetrahydrobiopterin dehydratase
MKGKLLKCFLAISLMATIFPVICDNQQATANSNPMVLNETEINQKLQSLSGWEKQSNTITRTFQFPNFVKAIDFVNKLVEPAEKAGHHPDIAISYNKVTISLTTHDAGGITQKDFDLAQIISQLAKQSVL